MRLFYVELETSGYSLPYIIAHNSEGEVRKEMQAFIKSSRIGNGAAKIVKINAITNTPVSGHIFRLTNDKLINPDFLTNEPTNNLPKR